MNLDQVKEFYKAGGSDLTSQTIDKTSILYESIDSRECVVLPTNQRLNLRDAEQAFNRVFEEIDTYKNFIDSRRPHLIYFCCHNMQHATSYRLPADSVDLVRRCGIDIYLHEILIKYKKHSNSYTTVFEFSEDDAIEIPLLDSISEIAKNNNIYITVYCCESDLPRSVHSTYPRLIIKYLDLYFHKQLRLLGNTQFSNLNLDLVNYKFICPNRRYDIHRHLCVLHLWKKDSLISWSYQASWNQLLQNAWFDVEGWKNSHPDIHKHLLNSVNPINKCVPLQLDQPQTKSQQISGNEIDFFRSPPGWKFHSSNLVQFYLCAFCAVVTLTRFADLGSYVDEKLLMPIVARRPFVILGKPEALKLMKSYGFRTFDRWWNESYDNIFNHEQRLLAVFEIIDVLASKPISELKNMLQEMDTVLDHNQKILKQHGVEHDR